MKLRAIVVDDEELARVRLSALLKELDQVEVVGEAKNASEALALLPKLDPDLLYLDVRMPGMSGVELARHLATLDDPPAVIFTTAYDAYAVEAFDAEAVGYLLKPVRGERLAAALERATRVALARLERVAGAEGQSQARTHVAARLRDTVKLIPVKDIYYFSADQKYTSVRHAGGTDLIEESLRSLEDEFGDRFVRVHRNALANVQQLAAIERDAEGQYDVVLRDIGEKLRVSRRLAGELRERLRL